MIQIPKTIIKQIEDQALGELPNEACGYLSGHQDQVTLQQPLTNTDKSPEHFSMDPGEQFKAIKEARKLGLKPMAVYHSHPDTPARLSEEDKRLLKDPNLLYVIYSVANKDIKAFRYDGKNHYHPEEIIITD